MKKVVLFLCLTTLLMSCSSSNNEKETQIDGFNKTEMLTNWADNIIIPSFQNYQAKVNNLKNATDNFTTTPDNATLEAIRKSWLEAYKAYQHVAFFEVGYAANSNNSLRMFSNTYPVQLGPNNSNGDLSGINENIANGNYSLTAVSSADEQGFPALDYMINGLGADDTAILSFYTSHANASGYKKYLTDLTNRLKTIADGIVNDWTTSYRTSYIGNNGNSISSSVNITVNAFVKTFEKDVRSGKVGIPAGYFSNGTLYADKVEAYYKNDVSKILLNEAIEASYNFFNGKNFNSGVEGSSLKTYLEYVNAVRNGQNLGDIINNQFVVINTQNNQLNSSFSKQIESDNSKMIAAFDAMQQNVITFKLDMMQALNITVDYVDNDGD